MLVADLIAAPAAAVVLGAVAALLVALGGHLEPLEQQIQDQAVAHAQATLGAAAYAAAFATGQALPWADLVAHAQAALVAEQG